MSPGLLGAVLGGFFGLVIGVVASRAVNAMLDGQIARASEEDAKKFTTIRRIAGPVAVVTTIAEVAVVGYVLGEVLAG